MARFTAAEIEAAMEEYGPRTKRCARFFWGRLPQTLRTIGLDELEQVAAIALWQSAQRYDSDLGAQFFSYAQHRILGAMADAMRAAKLWRRDGEYAEIPLSISNPLSDRDEAEHHDISDGNRAADAIESELDSQKIHELAGTVMSERYRRVLRRSVAEGDTLLEIARDMGIGVARVSQIRAAAIGKLQMALRAA